MFDESAQLLDKIPNIIQRISKTRGNQVESKMKFKKAREMADKIDMVYVTSDEFETYLGNFNAAVQELEQIQMYFEDDRSEKQSKDLATML